MLVNNSDNHKKSCEFADELISFLYGEIEDSENEQFSSHLNSCSTCADEVKAFSNMRASIHDWKTSTFDKVSTPEIIWTKETIEVSKPDSINNVSWLENIRRQFALNRAFISGGTIAALIIFGFLGFYLFTFNQKQNMSSNSSNTVLPDYLTITELAETEDAVIKKDIPNYLDNTKVENSVNLPEESKAEITEQKYIPVKSGSKYLSKITAETKLKARKNSNVFANSKDKITKTRTVPKLNDLPDEADDVALHLTDLFDEIDND